MSDFTSSGAYDPTVANGPLYTAAQEQEKKFYASGAQSSTGGGPRSTDKYAQAKEAYYSGFLFEQLHARRRVLEARRDNAIQQLNMVQELLKVLVD